MASSTYDSPGMGRHKVQCSNPNCKKVQYAHQEHVRTQMGWQCSNSSCERTHDQIDPYKVR